MRPGTLQSASKQIDRLKKRLKKRASINSNLFCDNITERLEALAYDDGDYAYVDGYNPFYGEY